MAKSLSRQQNRLAQRARIVRATLDICRTKGLAYASLNTIAARAKVAKGVVLYYFGSKENLIKTAFQSVAEGARERLIAAVAACQDQPAPAQIDALIDTLLDPQRYNFADFAAYLDFTAHAAHVPQLGKIEDTANEQFALVMEQALAPARAQGLIRPVSAEESVIVLRALEEGLKLQWLMTRDKQQLPKLRELCRSAFYRYLGLVPETDAA